MATLIRGIAPIFLAALCMSSYGEIRLNGFATIATGLTTDSDETLYGYDDALSFEEDSLLGLQASSDLGEGLEATVQIKAEGGDDWDPKFEWAYIGYTVNDNVKFIFGRQRQPYYVYSDYVDVGYAYHWIVPPRGVYSLPFDSTDAISVLITNSFGPVESNLQLMTGRNKSTINLGGEETSLDTKDSFTINWTLGWEWVSFRFGYTQAKLDLPLTAFDGLADNWTAAAAGVRAAAAVLPNGAELNAIATRMESVTDEIKYREDDASFGGVGLTIDYKNFLLVAEATKLDLDDGFIGKNDSKYISAGYRINDAFMVHATYGIDEDDAPLDMLNGIPMSPTGGLVPDVDAAVNGLLLGTQGALVGFNEETKYHTLGLRWDFHPSAALKAEYTQFKDDLDDSQDANLISFAISTVF